MNNTDIKANEAFFINTINSIHEYGLYAWKDKCLIYKKIGNKLTANEDDLEHIRQLVSPEFFALHFEKLN